MSKVVKMTFLIIISLIVNSCGGDKKERISAGVSAPFDLGSVMDQVHFAFRSDGDLFVGGDINYSVKVAKNGSFYVTPAYYLEGIKREVTLGPSAEFKTVSISGNKITNQNVSINEKSNIEINSGDFVEILKNSYAGVEQSWKFSKKPESSGDLVIIVEVSGVDYTGQTGSGLHFASEKTKPGLSYGNGTWIDANGTKTPVIPEWRNGAIKITVPQSVIEASAFPAVLDPAISPEFGMDKPVFGMAQNVQQNPAIVFDGTNYMAVWEDARLNVSGTASFNIYGARINKNGIVIDRAGFKISKYSQETNPAIAFDGENYLVVWSMYDSSIRGRRVSKDGEILDESEIDISEGQEDDKQKNDPAVAFDGENYLVVWRTSETIYGTRVTKEGIRISQDVYHGKIFRISPIYNSANIPVVAFDGENYLVVWEEDLPNSFAIYGIRVSKKGFVLDKEPVAISNERCTARSPDIAFDGSDYLVIWQDYCKGSNDIDIYGTRVSKSLEVLDPDGIPISTASNQQLYPKVAFDGTDYFAVWSDNRRNTSYDIYGAHVDKNGIVLEKEGVVVNNRSGSQTDPAIAFDGKNYLIVWGNGKDIYGMRMSPDGGFPGTSGSGSSVFGPVEIPVSGAMNGQSLPDVLFDGTNYFVVWLDARGNSSSIYGSRVGVNGEILDPAGIFIAENVHDRQRPSVAFDGTNYLIVWESFPVELEYIMGYYESRLLGARVRKNGKMLDAEAFEISKLIISYRDQSPEVVFNGSSFMVVWTTHACEYDNSQPHPPGWICYVYVKGKNVLKDGTVPEKGKLEINGASVSSIACGVSNCLLLWRENYDHKITGALFSGEFGRLSSSEILISETASSYDVPPSVAFDGRNYMVLWGEENGYSVNGIRITDDGVLLDKGTRINHGANSPDFRDIVFDGENYLAVWQGGRSVDSSRLDIYGSRIATDGTVLCEEDMIFSADEAQEAAPAVASSGDGKSIIVYQHFDERNNFNTYRIAARLVDPDINAFSDWDNAKPDEDFENPIIDEDAENIGDYDIFSPNSDGDEIESDEDSFLDLDAGPDDDTTDSEKKGSGCSITIFAN